MNVKEAAKRAGVSVRTMRYYEEVGLIHPIRDAENNYRDYDDGTVMRVRLIRAYRELQFPLEQIRLLLDAPRMERDAMLVAQIEHLEERRQRIDNRIALARSLRMIGPERLAQIDFENVDVQMRQAQESLEKNGEWQRIYRQAKEITRERMEAESAGLLKHLADVANTPEEGIPEAIGRLKKYIEENFYPCTPEILRVYARSFGGDGLLAQALEEAGGVGAPDRLRERLECRTYEE